VQETFHMNLEIVLLADRQSALPAVAKWWQDAWGYMRPGSTPHDFEQEIRAKLDPEDLPIHLLAVVDDIPVGAAALKKHELKEVFPARENWLGSVVVDPDYRHQGVASALTLAVESLARSRQVRLLHLQTECLSGGLYAKLGWKPELQLNHAGRKILLMVRHLSNSTAGSV
jgi:GNAT superfamily N-acetyltransferase